MKEVYFDNAATTKMSGESLNEFAKYSCAEYGNSSSLHGKGINSEKAVLNCEKTLMDLVGAASGNVVFTSGATESNNLAIFGYTRPYRRSRIICSRVEHPSVTACMAELESRGFEIVWLEPDNYGRAAVGRVKELVDENTVLVSLSHVNSETGSVNDIEAIGRAIREKNAKTVFHVDAAQSLGKLKVDVQSARIGLLSFSSHKIHAAKGCGGLYIAKGVKVQPVFFGGKQQRDVRSGTLNTPAIASMGVMLKYFKENAANARVNAAGIRRIITESVENIATVSINSPEDGSPFILNMSAVGMPSEVMMRRLEGFGIYVSAGSGCSSKSAKDRVLDYCGAGKEISSSSIRLSFSIYNTNEEAEYFCMKYSQIINEHSGSKISK